MKQPFLRTRFDAEATCRRAQALPGRQTSTGRLEARSSSLAAVFLRLFQHEAQHFLRYGRIPHWRKRLPMERRGAVLAQGGQVARRAVTLVRREPVHREDW